MATNWKIPASYTARELVHMMRVAKERPQDTFTVSTWDGRTFTAGELREWFLSKLQEKISARLPELAPSACTYVFTGETCKAYGTRAQAVGRGDWRGGSYHVLRHGARLVGLGGWFYRWQAGGFGACYYVRLRPEEVSVTLCVPLKAIERRKLDCLYQVELGRDANSLRTKYRGFQVHTPELVARLGYRRDPRGE